MRYFLVVIIFLSIIRINAACQTDIEFAKINGKVFFKMQSKGNYLESMDFEDRYRWHTYITKEAELYINLGSSLSDISIILDNNEIDIDRIIVKIGLSIEKLKKLNNKDYDVIRERSFTILRISREAINFSSNKIIINYSLQTEEKEVLKNFYLSLNDFNTAKVQSNFSVIIPQYIDYAIEVVGNLSPNVKSENIAESFDYIPYKPGKLTTENYRYTSTRTLYELNHNEKEVGSQGIKFKLNGIKQIPILN